MHELGLCEGSAHLRITAARLLGDIPEIERKLEEGALNLSKIALVNTFCRENEIKKVEEKRELFSSTDKENSAKESTKRISKDQLRVSVILNEETLKIIEEVKALLGHDLSSDEMFQKMAFALKEKIEREKFKLVEGRKSKGTIGRTIPAQVKREVYLRDTKCVNCGSKKRLNFDHRIPYSMGGKNSVENIRLLCFHCNQRAWITSSG